MSEFLRLGKSGWDVEAIDEKQEWELFGCGARDEVSRFLGIVWKVLGVKLKAILPIFGVWGLCKPIIGYGFTENITTGDRVEVFVEELNGGVWVALVALKYCGRVPDGPRYEEGNNKNHG